MSARCPLCGGPLEGWRSLPLQRGDLSVGLPREATAGQERVLERCGRCGLGLERGAELDLDAEWKAVAGADGQAGTVAAPNRASLQATIGGDGWAALELAPGRMLHTARSLALLAERTGHRLEGVGCPPLGRSQIWLWQTLLNGLTLRPNFARDLHAGRLHPRGAKQRGAYAIDLIVTLLAAPLVALVSLPLELIASLAGRGGELRGRVADATG